jgi:hypothetical protein
VPLSRRRKASLKLPRYSKITKAYQNKDGDIFVDVHIADGPKDDGEGSNLAGFWDSKNKKIWSSDSDNVELIDTETMMETVKVRSSRAKETMGAAPLSITHGLVEARKT